ncbi:prolyl-tRNA synthetase associated domain-containing protein [Lactococcus taiwanensis]|uniref:prolyl-tRNA synthetase associated domain-containing protein n=1 Tax=Lactococcus taiwanensis TaxID=1151742 RepID=UPI00351306E1
MRSFGEVKELLVKLSIPYRIVEHPASHSTEESDAFIQGYEGCRSKTLVLANKKSTQFYMIIMDDKKRIEMDHLSNILKVKRLHFVSEERLEAMLGLSSGIVSLFGLVGTRYDNMHIYFDREMLEEHRIQTFHPNDNTKTIFIKMEACFTILEAQGYTYEVVDL